MERRTFLKAGCSFCLLGAAGMLLPMLSGCSTTHGSTYHAVVSGNKIEVPLSLFDKATTQIIRPKGWYYDIAVEKNPDSTYTSLLLKCTHMDNQLVAAGNGFHCNLHGSQFDKVGAVTNGPAEQPLTRYKTNIENNNLIINI